MNAPTQESPVILPDSSSATPETRFWRTIEDLKWLLSGLVLFAVLLWFKSFYVAAFASAISVLGLKILAYEVDADIGSWVLGAAAFLITWGACTAHYGFLLGFGLGWIPATILAQIVMLVWRFV